MKNYIILIIVVAVIYSCSGDIYDNIDGLVDSETVYPPAYNQDSVIAKMGDQRIEIDLLNGRRLSAAQMSKLMPKSKKTVITYLDRELVIDSVCSWVNVTGLTVARTYHFKIYTEDSYGNRSVPVSISAKPFTVADRESLKVIASVSASSTLGIVACGASDAYTFCDMRYSYTDNDNHLQSGETDDRSLILSNLTPGTANQVKVSYHLLPLNAIDTIWLDDVVTVQTMTQQAFDDYINNTRPFPAVAFTHGGVNYPYYEHILSAAAPFAIMGGDFDIGGQGVAFNKQTNSNSGGYRIAGGDNIDRVAIGNYDGRKAVEGSSFGDWQVYTLDVRDAGEYKIEIRYSNGMGVPSLESITVDALDFWGTLSLPVTGGWTRIVDFEIGTVNLSVGKHKLKFSFIGGANAVVLTELKFTKL
jgi:hypothetical protein